MYTDLYTTKDANKKSRARWLKTPPHQKLLEYFYPQRLFDFSMWPRFFFLHLVVFSYREQKSWLYRSRLFSNGAETYVFSSRLISKICFFFPIKRNNLDIEIDFRMHTAGLVKDRWILIFLDLEYSLKYNWESPCVLLSMRQRQRATNACWWIIAVSNMLFVI